LQSINDIFLRRKITAEFGTREIVRDELSIMQIPERLSIIEEQNRGIKTTLNIVMKQKADSLEVEALRYDVKAEIANGHTEVTEKIAEVRTEIGELRTEVTEKIGELRGDINTIKVEQTLTRDLIKHNSKLALGILFGILSFVVGIFVKIIFLP